MRLTPERASPAQTTMFHLILAWLMLPLLWCRGLLARSPARPERILIMQTAKIGDFVSTTPLFREIKRSYPSAYLTVLLHPTNLPLARYNPRIDEALPLPAHGLRGVRGRLWLARTLRARRIDTFVCVSPSLAAWVVPVWAGVVRRISIVPNRSGMSYRLAAPLLTHAEGHRDGRLVIETAFQLVSQIGVRPGSLATEAFASPDASAVVQALLPSRARALLGLGISSGNKLKELGESRLLALAEALLEATGADLVLVGGEQDRGLAERVAAALPKARVVNSAGSLDLDQLPALLSRLSVYVGVDSGITYLADACGVPVVDLMGPADADDQRPSGPDAVVLRTALPCAPCSHAFSAPYRCRLGTRACVLQAPLAPVIEAARHLVVKAGMHQGARHA